MIAPHERKEMERLVHEVDLRGNVPSYGQQQCCYCGAASAQMIMNGYPDPLDRVWIDQGPPNTPNCWDTIQANNSTDPTDVAQGWCTDPRGLRECLRILNPPPSGTWNIFANNNRDTVMFNILYWMNRLHYPVATLIDRGGHWVVIVRFVSDIEPVSGSSPNLQQITVHDPEPHNVGSIITKTGALWYGDEWNGSIIYAGTWFDTYVAVIEPPVKGVVKVKEVVRVGERFIEPKEAVRYALKHVDELGLSEKPPYNILQKKGIRNLEPILVREEIKPGMEEEVRVPYYYLVPFGFEWETGACNVKLARVGVIVNAYTGDFEEIGAFGRPVRFLPRKEAINIAARAMKLTDREIEEMIERREITANMMYQPSEITHIRIYPFWKIAIKENILYIDQLGTLYATIQPSRPGD